MSSKPVRCLPLQSVAAQSGKRLLRYRRYGVVCIAFTARCLPLPLSLPLPLDSARLHGLSLQPTVDGWCYRAISRAKPLCAWSKAVLGVSR